MLRARDFRKQAWECLGGKWGTMALCAFIVAVITGVCGGLSVIVIGGIVLFVITGPLAMGSANLALRVARKSDVAVEMQFSGFKMFAKSFLLWLINNIFIALWSLLFVIPGIIKSFSYALGYYVLLDNPELSSNDARKKSMEMMRGNKWRLFCLQLSFIGWGLLCIVTLGILSFWVKPYMDTAVASFYQSLLPEKQETPTPENAEQQPVSQESDNDAAV